jgi:hypothetical protein
MSEISAPAAPARQELRSRLFWFVAGSVVNYLLISTPFHLLKTHTSLPVWAISAFSLGISSLFFFFWNYTLNFRTDARKRDAFVRYVAAVVLMWLLSTGTLTAFKHYNAHLSLTILKIAVDLDVVATQFVLAGLKFLLYHLWVFPTAGRSGPGQ